MNRPRLSCRLLIGMGLVISLVLNPKALQAETYLRFTQWNGSLELGGQWEKQDSETPTGKQMLRRFRLEERLRLGLQGFLLDPQFMRFSAAGGFGLFQEALSLDGREDDSHGKLREYDLSANWLEQKPVRLMAYANRTEQVVSRELTPRTDVRYEARGAALQLDRFLLPSNLSYRRYRIFQESSFAGNIVQWDQVGEDVFYRGRRRSERTDLDLQYRFQEIDDRIHPDFDRHSNMASLFHRLNPGAAEQLNLTTTARYFGQEGPVGLTTTDLYATERADLYATERLTTALGFIYDRREVKDSDQNLDEVTATYTAFGNLSHQLYESLTSRLSGEWTLTDFPDGKEERYQARGSFNYRKRIPLEGYLFLGLNGRYEWVDRVAIDQSVVQEDIVTAIPFEMKISIPFGAVVNLSTLAVINLTKGLTLVEPTDYTVTSGPDFVEVDVITTDPTRVQAGDTLQVRFTFRSVEIRFETEGIGASIGFDFSWIGIFYEHERQNQHRLSGQADSMLNDVTWDTASVQFRFRPGKATILFLNEYRSYDSTPLAYRERHFSQILTYALLNRLTANLQAAETLTDYTIPDRETNQLDSRLHLNWYPGSGLEVSPFAAYRRYLDTVAPDETIRSGGVRSRFAWGKLEITGFAQFERRSRDGSDIDDYQLDLRLIRRF